MLRFLLVLVLTAAAATAQTATVTPYGSGCYDRFASFYETVPPGPFDFGTAGAPASGFTLLGTGSGFLALPAFAQWQPPSSAAVVLALSDDSLSAPLPLGFVLPLPGSPGTSTSQVIVASNGYVFLNGGTANDFSPTVGEFLGQDLRLAPFWTDLNPGAGGSVLWETSAGVARLTFLAVPEFAAGGTATFQVSLHATGEIDVVYQSTNMSTHTALVGWTPGHTLHDPGSRDLSAVLPFVTDVDHAAVQLAAIGRPILGTTLQLSASNQNVGTTGTIFFLGATQFGGLDLSVIGMGGCRQYASVDLFWPVPSTAAAVVLQLPVPSTATLVGQSVFAQAAVGAPGANTLGFETTNGLALVVGIN